MRWTHQIHQVRTALTTITFLLFPVKSGKMALRIPRDLWTAALMVPLVVLSIPVAEGRDSPRKCRAATPQSPPTLDPGPGGPVGWGRGDLWAGAGGLLSSQTTQLVKVHTLPHISSLRKRAMPCSHFHLLMARGEDNPHATGLGLRVLGGGGDKVCTYYQCQHKVSRGLFLKV